MDGTSSLGTAEISGIHRQLGTEDGAELKRQAQVRISAQSAIALGDRRECRVQARVRAPMFTVPIEHLLERNREGRQYGNSGR